jgi:hypothetical protein
MTQFRKKPVVIEAIQYGGLHSAGEMAVEWGHPFVEATVIGEGAMSIKTLEGILFVSEGDWIIKGVKGEFYPCKDDIFRMTYEPVLPTPQESDNG